MKKKILLPADEELKKILDTSFLHRDTFEILVAHNGGEAMQILEEQDPLLAILDLDMEGHSGEQCCHEIKKDPFLSDIPLALIITSSQPETLERCRAAGCDAVLTKAYDKSLLLSTLCEMLNIHLRGERRVAVELRVRLRKGHGRSHEGVALDLNHNGLFIQSSWLQPVGTHLNLALPLEDRDEPQHCMAEVIWVNHPEWIKAHRLPVGMGICFIEPDDDFKQAIDAAYRAADEA